MRVARKVKQKSLETYLFEIKEEQAQEEFNTEVDELAETILSRVTKGRLIRPRRLFVYGTGGIGKSTFASKAPNPLFIQTEEGANEIETVARTPVLKSFGEVMQALRELYQQPGEYRTVVIDTVDALETMIWKELCQAEAKTNIEDFGFNKGYTKALDLWAQVKAGLDALRDKGLASVLIAHAMVKRFENPEGEGYDRYIPKINDKAAALLKEWSDECFFASYQILTRKEKSSFGKETTKGGVIGTRYLRTAEQPFCIAKNRLDNIPEKIPLEWSEYAKYLPTSTNGTGGA